MDHNTHLKNLVALAYADGSIEESEMKLLTNSAGEMGISEETLNHWVENAEEILIDIPDDDEQREDHLISMITMAAADGFFSQDEYDLCKLISDKLGYDGLSRALKRSMNRSNLKNLVALACADGVVDDSEMEVLKESAEKAGVPEAELHDWIENSASFIHVIPEREEDRETQLIQMLSLAIADGEFSQPEYELCQTVAGRLGFSEEELKLIIKLSFNGEINFEELSKK